MILAADRERRLSNLAPLVRASEIERAREILGIMRTHAAIFAPDGGGIAIQTRAGDVTRIVTVLDGEELQAAYLTMPYENSREFSITSPSIAADFLDA